MLERGNGVPRKWRKREKMGGNGDFKKQKSKLSFGDSKIKISFLKMCFCRQNDLKEPKKYKKCTTLSEKIILNEVMFRESLTICAALSTSKKMDNERFLNGRLSY